MGATPKSLEESTRILYILLEYVRIKWPLTYNDGDVSNTLKRIGFWLTEQKPMVVKWQIQCRSKTLQDLPWEPVYVEYGEKTIIQRTTGKNWEWEPDEIVKLVVYHYPTLEEAQAAFDTYLEKSRGRMAGHRGDLLADFEVRFTPVNESGSVVFKIEALPGKVSS